MSRDFEIVEVEQRSEAWFSARIGRVTGSTASVMTAKGVGAKEAVSRVNLRTKLALERITGRPVGDNTFTTKAMEQGIEREPLALAAYEAATGQLIQQTGFLKHSSRMIGCSLDAHVGDFHGLVSIKCPQPPAHWETLKTKKISTDYLRQIQHEQLVTGALWTDYVSFNPDFEEPLQLCIIRVERDTAELQMYDAALTVFLVEVAAQEAEIRAAARSAA